MAYAVGKMPDDFLLKLSRLGNQTDEIIPRVLQAGAEIVESQVRANLQSAIGKNTQEDSRSTGELLSALGTSPVKVNRDGIHDIKIGFNEPRSDGHANAKIANILEHGSSTQPARPFLRPAKRRAKQPAIEAMKSKLEQEMNNL